MILKPNIVTAPAIGLRGYVKLPPPHVGAYIRVEISDYTFLDGAMWFQVKQLLKGPRRWVRASDFYREMPTDGDSILKTH
jgi:hypothetical protein